MHHHLISKGLGIYKNNTKKLNVSNSGAEVTGVMQASSSVKVKGSNDYPCSSLTNSQLSIYPGSDNTRYASLSSNLLSLHTDSSTYASLSSSSLSLHSSSTKYSSVSSSSVYLHLDNNHYYNISGSSSDDPVLGFSVNGSRSLSCYSSYTKINNKLVVPEISNGLDTIDISSDIRRGTNGTRWSLSNSQLFMSYYYSDAHYDVTLGHTGDDDGLVVKRIDDPSNTYHDSVVIGANLEGHTTIKMDNWLATNGTTVVVNNNHICCESSSRRYKKDINYDIDTDKIFTNLEKLSPVTFRYKSSDSPYTQLGLIAEDVELIDDNLVNYSTKIN